ncbi:MAG: alpha/beta fold hydrolase [Nitrospirales bacterium]
MRRTKLNTFWVFLILAAVLLSGCQTPVGVARVDPEIVNYQLTRNVLSEGVPSPSTDIVLHVFDLKDAYFDDPRAALNTLHGILLTKDRSSPVAFALAELSYLYAKKGMQPSYYLAAAMYAYLYLFPENPANQPYPLDSRIRVAADLYNRSLTSAFLSKDRSTMTLQSGSYSLPFGTLQIELSEESLHWGNRKLTNFIPTAELEVRGLQNRYRRAGIGVPLAAEQILEGPDEGLQIGKGKVPITAFMRFKQLFSQLAEGTVRANWEVYVSYDQQKIQIHGKDVPLETEFTSSLAASLADSPVWARELKGFFLGDLVGGTPSQLGGIEPYRPGRIPVVFVHGTASGSGRWADMVNDLIVDPQIHDRFQFWFFTYDTGSPILYSASLFRDALQKTVQQLDEKYHDPALQRMVIIGHSQGGLLAKLAAIDSGTRFWDAFSSKPFEEIDVSPETRELLQKSLFVKPLPFVNRLVFIATPQHGSYVSGSWAAHQIAKFVKLPGRLVSGLADVMTKNYDKLKFKLKGARFGSVYAMVPGSPLMTSLAPLPLAPGVSGHSIIAVKDEGPLEEGTDGVVKYTSAHLDGIDSEFIVRSGHSCQSNTHTIQEVRRILLLHAEES